MNADLIKNLVSGLFPENISILAVPVLLNTSSLGEIEAPALKSPRAECDEMLLNSTMFVVKEAPAEKTF